MDYTFEAKDECVCNLVVILVHPQDPFGVMDLPVNYRILHYALNRNIFPKKVGNNYITNLDREIIWHVEERRMVNFTHLMMKMIKSKYYLLHVEVRSKIVKHKVMPYGAIITKIFKELKVPLEGEEFVPFPPNWRVSTMTLKIMKLVKKVVKGWMYGPYARTNGYCLVDLEGTLPPLVLEIKVLEVNLQ